MSMTCPKYSCFQRDAGSSVVLGYGSIFLFLSQEYEMGYMKYEMVLIQVKNTESIEHGTDRYGSAWLTLNG